MASTSKHKRKRSSAGTPKMTQAERSAFARELERDRRAAKAELKRERRREAARARRREQILQWEVNALRGGWRIGWRMRRQLAPLFALAAVYGAGLLLWAFHPSLWIVFLAGSVLTYGWWVAGAAYRLPRTGYLVTCMHALTVWLTLAAGRGVSPPMPAWLAAVGGLLALPWWWQFRIRPERATLPEPTKPPPEPDQVDPRVAVWRAKVSRQGGPLEYSDLTAVVEIGGGWRGRILLHRGNTDRAIMATKDIGAAYGLRAGGISIEPPPTGELDQADILVLEENPLSEVLRWTKPTLSVLTGISVVGWYIDLAPVHYRHYRVGSGPVHTLISGSTDSGKSKTVEQLLAEERHSGVIVSWVIDPQRGASLPDWQDNVERYARTVEEARDLLLRARVRMYARNEFMASVKWTDPQGRQRKGIGDFTPMDPRHLLPMLSITIDEAQTILNDKFCRELIVEMIGMSRKCGIKFRLITQVPLLENLGNSSAIRDAVAAGNVIVLRTANRLTGQVAFNGALAVDPVSLPKQWPDGSTTSGLGFVFAPGSDRAATMRVGLINDPFGWATSGNPATLEEFDEDDAIRLEYRDYAGMAWTGSPPPAQATAAGPSAADYGAQPPQPTAEQQAEEADEEEARGRGERAVVQYLKYLAGATADRGLIISDIQAELMRLGEKPPGIRTIDKALSDLAANGVIENPERGLYRIPA